ncbi:AraC family transcriptional regulator [Puia sp. P3]|uniref:AraC family transcriptional regulator n=1 Tax=Puia sp. P3 TaxID=3423952 RepID=UPI003D671E6A
MVANSHADISLQTLSAIAHYSPFHLQKVFKQVIGESPKQYMLKLRLEIALLQLIIHPQKTIQEIAADTGFSSPAAFSRAIRSHYGRTPVEFRALSHSRKMKLLHGGNPMTVGHPALSDMASRHAPVAIHIVKKEPIKGCYQIVSFDDPRKIHRAFQELAKTARARDGMITTPAFYGIITPHQRNIYKACLAVTQGHTFTDKFPVTEIKGGIFASFIVQGDLWQTTEVIHYFYYRWLPESGYKISATTGFETFVENPACTAYQQLTREIHIPIEPAQ